MMLNSVEHRAETRDVQGWKVKLVSYKIGEKYYCHIDNVDPGATIARADGVTRNEAVQNALKKATARLGKKLDIL